MVSRVVIIGLRPTFRLIHQGTRRPAAAPPNPLSLGRLHHRSNSILENIDDANGQGTNPIRFVLQLGVLIYALGLIPALIAFFLAAGVLADLLGVL